MPITLEQARTFEAVADCGSISKASVKLRKAHSAVVYAIQTVESELKLKLLDRSQYRSTLTPDGKRVLELCKKLLSVEKEMKLLCGELTMGWESHLKIVYEGVLPFEPIAQALSVLSKKKLPTKIEIFAEYHRDVEPKFIEQDAQIMISVIPPLLAELESIKLAPIKLLLVAHSGHELVQGRKKKGTEELRKHPFLTVKGSDQRIGLNTGMLDSLSFFHMSDFNTKKTAILNGMGFGWLPEYMITKELQQKRLKPIHWEKESLHTLHPRLYHRGASCLGKAAHLFVKEVLNFSNCPL